MSSVFDGCEVAARAGPDRFYGRADAREAREDDDDDRGVVLDKPRGCGVATSCGQTALRKASFAGPTMQATGAAGPLARCEAPARRFAV